MRENTIHDLEDYLNGFRMCDELSQKEIDEILEDYEDWDKNCLDEDCYYYDGIPYIHTDENNLNKFKELCTLAKTINENGVEGFSDDKYELSIRVNAIPIGYMTCNLNIKTKEFKVKVSMDYSTIESLGEDPGEYHDINESFSSITDTVDCFYDCVKTTTNIYDGVECDKLDQFFDLVDEIYFW